MKIRHLGHSDPCENAVAVRNLPPSTSCRACSQGLLRLGSPVSRYLGWYLKHTNQTLLFRELLEGNPSSLTLCPPKTFEEVKGSA